MARRVTRGNAAQMCELLQQALDTVTAERDTAISALQSLVQERANSTLPESTAANTDANDELLRQIAQLQCELTEIRVQLDQQSANHSLLLRQRQTAFDAKEAELTGVIHQLEAERTLMRLQLNDSADQFRQLQSGFAYTKELLSAAQAQTREQQAAFDVEKAELADKIKTLVGELAVQKQNVDEELEALRAGVRRAAEERMALSSSYESATVAAQARAETDRQALEDKHAAELAKACDLAGRAAEEARLFSDQLLASRTENETLKRQLAWHEEALEEHAGQLSKQQADMTLLQQRLEGSARNLAEARQLLAVAEERCVERSAELHQYDHALRHAMARMLHGELYLVVSVAVKLVGHAANTTGMPMLPKARLGAVGRVLYAVASLLEASAARDWVVLAVEENCSALVGGIVDLPFRAAAQRGMDECQANDPTGFDFLYMADDHKRMFAAGCASLLRPALLLVCEMRGALWR